MHAGQCWVCRVVWLKEHNHIHVHFYYVHTQVHTSTHYTLHIPPTPPGIVGLILPDLLSAPLILLPDLVFSERLLPVAIVILVAIGSVEAYRGAYNASHAEEAPDERVYPAQRLGNINHQPPEKAPGVGVFASWLGGLPGWLSGGWWLSQRSMSIKDFEDMKQRELSNGRLAMYETSRGWGRVLYCCCAGCGA